MRGSRRSGARRKPGQLNKPTIEAVKAMGPVGERAIGVLVSAMEDARVPWSCHIQAASLICDRAFGRAPQSLSLEVTRRLNDLTLDELRQLEARLASEGLTIDVTPAAEIPSSKTIDIVGVFATTQMYPR